MAILGHVPCSHYNCYACTVLHCYTECAFKERSIIGHGKGAPDGTYGRYAVLPPLSFEICGIVAQARSMIDAFGFGSLKLKAGILEPDVEVTAALALREAFGPKLPIRVDPNAMWSFETALAQGRRLRGAIEYLEDPVRGQKEMARFRRELDVPLATNMCTTSFDDLPSSIALGSEDIILADHHFWGGLRASMELARLCTVFGRGLSMHSNSHAGISLVAMTLLGAALPALVSALDALPLAGRRDRRRRKAPHRKRLGRAA